MARRITTHTGTNTTTAADGQATRTGRQTAADLAFLTRAMKAPALLDAAERRVRFFLRDLGADQHGRGRFSEAGTTSPVALAADAKR